jgi:hypothetical protein
MISPTARSRYECAGPCSAHTIRGYLIRLRTQEPAVFEQLAPLVDDIGDWLARSMASAEQKPYPDAAPLLLKLDAVAAQPTNGSWGSLRAGLLTRLRELVTPWRDWCASA